ncbi:MAG: monofunctional biosynthetic peptidoglycan transglycosylase [Gammaproteobacteria bacterium]|nr:monofunctional biosynthetic peptidoglycan transglycosylase [Gammaproteobacteria bacterium]
MANKKKTVRQKLKQWLIYGILIFVGTTSSIVALLGFIPINTSAFMIQQHIADFKENKGFVRIEQQWTQHSELSPHIFSAVIAAEDQLFYQHIGFDFNSIYAALKNNSSGGKLRGASTISQQVAKNLFLSPSRSLWRKGVEAWFTILIELFWSKQRILLVYVNIAEFGDHLYGVQSASQYYFSIPASKLTPHQAALLAASLPNPILFKVDRPNKKLIDKQQWILRQMRNLNYL